MPIVTINDPKYLILAFVLFCNTHLIKVNLIVYVIYAPWRRTHTYVCLQEWWKMRWIDNMCKACANDLSLINWFISSSTHYNMTSLSLTHTHTHTHENTHKHTQTIVVRKAKFYGCIYWTNSISTDWKLSRWWFLVFHIRCLAVYTRAKNWLSEVNYVGNRKPYLLFAVNVKVYTYIRNRCV